MRSAIDNQAARREQVQNRQSQDQPRPGPEITVPASRRLLLQESPLAGFQYHVSERLWPILYLGAPLALRREPHNPHDVRAVATHYAGQRIGYVPRMKNTAVSQLMDHRQKLAACVVALSRDPDPWQRVRIAIDLRVST